jgi:hypothetical protein
MSNHCTSLRITLNIVLVAFLLSMIFVLPIGVYAVEPMLIFAANAPIYGGDCYEEPANVLAGSMLLASVQNTTDESGTELVEIWPAGYTLEAALDLTKGEPFVETPGLIDRLQPARFISVTNQYEKICLDAGVEGISLYLLNLKHFAMQIPADLAGHTLNLRARYTGMGVSLVSNTSHTFHIIPPCTVNDEASILSSRIYAKYFSGDDAEAILLADSMLELGWSNAVGWFDAMISARNNGNYEKQLLYLDRLYLDYGLADMIRPSNPRLPRIVDGNYDPEQQNHYNRVREVIIQAIEDQKQELK